MNKINDLQPRVENVSKQPSLIHSDDNLYFKGEILQWTHIQFRFRRYVINYSTFFLSKTTSYSSLTTNFNSSILERQSILANLVSCRLLIYSSSCSELPETTSPAINHVYLYKLQWTVERNEQAQIDIPKSSLTSAAAI